MEKTKRQSNFELLRILAMIMIVLFHIQKNGPQRLLTGDYGYFGKPIYYLRLIVFYFGVTLGDVGNGLFIIISGYFMNANDHIDTGKIAKKLLSQLGFAAVLLVIANSLWVTFFRTETVSVIGKATISNFNNGWWFVGYYFLIILFAKLFLNEFTAKLTKAQFQSLLLTVLALSQFAWTSTILESLATGLRTAAIGIFYFLLGGYIARYNPFNNFKSYTFVLGIAAAYAFWFLSQYNLDSQEIDKFVKSGNTNFVRTVERPGNYGIIAVITVICLFELFRRLRVPYISAINFCGKSTLMIYFIHENNFFQMFYKDDAWMESLTTNVPLYLLMWLKWTAIAFAFGLAAYCLYTLLGKLLPRMRSWFVVQEPSD